MLKIFSRSCTVVMLFTAFAGSIHAQYNKNVQTVFNSGYASYIISGNALDVVLSTPNTQCVLSEVTGLPADEGYTSRNNLINLKKINLYGSTLWDKTYQSADSDYKMEPRRLIRTGDDGFIVVGRAIKGNGITNPCAFKVDSTGNMIWSRIYYTNRTLFQDEPETSIARVGDDSVGAESYIMVRSGSVDSGLYLQDAVINALRINGSNGALVWNKRYNMQSRQTGDSLVRNYPKTIAFVPDTDSSFYFIAGTCLKSNSRSADSALFFLGIDKNGSVNRTYRSLGIGAYPQDEDAIYDDQFSERSIVMTYTHANSRLLDSSQISNRSQIGLMKLDRSLNITLMNYYYGSGMFEQQAARIQRNTANDAYVIAANTRLRAEYDSPWNISMLKTDKVGSVQFFSAYNTERYTHANSMVNADPATGDETYMIVGNRHSDYSGIVDSRIMKTDASGNTCGAVYLNPEFEKLSSSPVLRTLVAVDTTGSTVLDLVETAPDYYAEDCTDDQGPVFRGMRSDKLNRVTMDEAVIFPTLLYQSEKELNARIGSTSAQQLQIAVYSLEGRLIVSTSIKVAEGRSIEKVAIPDVTPGVYSVIITGSTGQRISATKFTRL